MTSSIRCKTCNKKSTIFVTDKEIKHVCLCGRNVVVEKTEKLKLPTIEDEYKKIIELKKKLIKTREDKYLTLRELIYDNKSVTREFLQKKESLKNTIVDLNNKIHMIETFSY
jgi:hypothetical protein